MHMRRTVKPQRLTSTTGRQKKDNRWNTQKDKW